MTTNLTLADRTWRAVVPVFALALLTSACAAVRPYPGDPGSFLLPPNEAGFEGGLSQKLTLHRPNGQDLDALASAEVDRREVRLAMLSPMGMRLLGLVWDGKKLIEERAEGVPKELPAAIILRDLQLTFWPEESVRRALPRGWVLESSRTERHIFTAGRPGLVIRYGPQGLKGSIEFINEAVRYSLTVSPLDQEDGPSR